MNVTRNSSPQMYQRRIFRGRVPAAGDAGDGGVVAMTGEPTATPSPCRASCSSGRLHHVQPHLVAACGTPVPHDLHLITASLEAEVAPIRRQHAGPGSDFTPLAPQLHPQGCV